MRTLDKALNSVSRGCLLLASACIVSILVAVVINIVDRMMGHYTPGTNEFAGYCVGAAGALGLASTFLNNKHIRMSLLLNRASHRARRLLENTCLVLSTCLSGFISFYLCRMVYISIMLEDRSTGSDGILLYIPQIPMALGFVILTLSMVITLMGNVLPLPDSSALKITDN